MITGDATQKIVKKPLKSPNKSADAFRTISEVAIELEIPTHVLRFWETKFSQIKPLKRGGGRRYYRPEDIAILRQIKILLYEDGYTIRGVRKLIRDFGLKNIKGAEKNLDKKSGVNKSSALGAKSEVPTKLNIEYRETLQKTLEELIALEEEFYKD
tara:strand:- start:20 stop:487 length:468 start_codon:yes stop_codon:yes gene_type:complete